MNLILFKKSSKCACCHEVETLYKLKIKKAGKEKVIGVCDICLEGLISARTEKEIQFKTYFINKILNMKYPKPASKPNLNL